MAKVQESADGRSVSPAPSPVVAQKQRSRTRSKSALGENVKTLVSDVKKEDAVKR